MVQQKIPFTIRLKTCLKMCIQRLRYAQEKQQALAKQDRRLVAKLLSDSKETKAQYRVENLINNDIHMELLEILELYCELLHARVNILNDITDEVDLISNHIEDGINEAVRAIVFSTLYVPEVKELNQMAELLTLKFGQEFLKVIREDHVGVPEKVLGKCSPALPKEDLVILYLKEIAITYDVPYSLLTDSESESETQSNDNEKTDDDNNDDGDGGNVKEKINGKPIVAMDNDENISTDEKHPITIRKPRQTSETAEKKLKIAEDIKKEVKIVHNKKKVEKTDELDELKKRFAALRR
ncbi:Ist1p NDAI_0F04170 [Naumovozyma dairenensis CBS 421]|uniref:Vacuolar protein sorting-associated protein IST1 n=1 Tax=Naumovozyma dairenensis (strain ATCC 10597 / BCRC 20456 / CBS 421 / NBRC 0211 / NRRL Y-12639) TaxID=1071378 RepID=G0WD74_NAUDC|nr:hypothetical protein NDAI_0F04170 [Naumovozyma dairenensis CBS 421]CCD25735.1 hypothetical protein NDAI_0F04170 [Naumovozyma dairenensis CBS 421]